MYVQDELPSSLDQNKIELVDYEVRPTLKLNRETALFDFLSIYLPGTNQVIPGTQLTKPREFSYDQASTYFKFKICTKSDLTDCILNTASIVFDSQPVFYTNTSKLCIEVDCMEYTICGGNNAHRSSQQLPSQLIEPTKSDELVFEVYPNPTKNKVNLNIHFNTDKNSQFVITLKDYSGKIIKELTVNQHDSAIFKSSFNLQNIASSLYFITLKTQENRYTKKIIKH